MLFKTSWKSESKLEPRTTLSDFSVKQSVILDFFDEHAQVNNMTNVSFSSGVFLGVFDFLVLLSFRNNELQQNIVIIQQQLLQSWTILFWLFQNWLQNPENLVM